MSDTQVGYICAALVSVAFIALVAMRIWVDHKEAILLLGEGEK